MATLSTKVIKDEGDNMVLKGVYFSTAYCFSIALERIFHLYGDIIIAWLQIWTLICSVFMPIE